MADEEDGDEDGGIQGRLGWRMEKEGVSVVDKSNIRGVD